MEAIENTTMNMPVLALRGLTVFPGCVLSFDVERGISIRALERAMEADQQIFLVAQREISTVQPGERDLYAVGTVSAVRQILRIGEGAVRVMMEGLTRARLRRLWQADPYLQANVEPISERKARISDYQLEALLRQTYGSFAEYAALAPRLGEEVSSGYAVLIDLDSGTVLAEKDSHTAVSPASMTKILTILVAAEQIGDLNDTAPVTQEITDFCFSNDCSVAGFLPGEAVPLGELFYGAILPSGADASLALANYVAGSQEAFVELMNRKAAELGLSESARFSNCVGLYSEDNVCPVYDMALILKAAMDNDLCRQVLTQKTFDIPPSEAHPEGLPLSNWFIRRIEDHMPEGVELLGAKTGFINESGNCAASMAQDASGRRFICVTAQAGGVWQCIYDHVALYGMA